MQQAPGSDGSVGFVGREEQLEVLDAAMARAVRFGAPQAVTIVGGLGLGKTRLVDEWLRTQRPFNVRIVRAAATSGGAGQSSASLDAPFVRQLLRTRFHLDGCSESEALVRFRAELQRVFSDRRVAEVAAMLGGFLGFELSDSPLSRALATRPEQASDVARAVLGRFFEQDAAWRPLIIVCEDLHAADDASLDILQGLAGELAEGPILTLFTGRPELLVRRPGWGNRAGNHARLDLPPLSRRELDTLIGAHLGTEQLAPGLSERAAIECSGSPFLLEQLLRLYRQFGILVAESAPSSFCWRFDEEEAARRHSVLTGEEAAHIRVAALSPAEREVLTRGAVFGSVFWTGGIVALGRLDVPTPNDEAVFGPDPAITETQQILTALAERGYIARLPDTSLPEETAWGFRHTYEEQLVRATMDLDEARCRKAFAAQWLESRGGPGRDGRLEMLAQLYEGAGDRRRAAYCYITAAANARSQLLLDRAHVLYLSAIGLLEVDDAVAKMDALYAAGDVGARLGRTREAITQFQEMLRLAWRLDLPNKGGAAHGRIGRLWATLGEHKRARAHLELARKLFEIVGDLPGVAAALDDLGRLHFLMGEAERSLDCHGTALAFREQLGDARGRALTLSRMGQVQHETGAFAEAGEHFAAALYLRRELGDQQGIAASLLDLGALERDLGHLDQALAILGEGRQVARAAGELLYECSLAIEIGDTYLAAGYPAPALEELRAARDLARRFGARLLMSEATRGMAEAELGLGDTTRAREHARAAFQIADRAGAPPLAGAALRVLGAILTVTATCQDDLDATRDIFDRAVELLSRAGAELELARTLTAYADLEGRAGRSESADALRAEAASIGRRASARPASSRVNTATRPAEAASAA